MFICRKCARAALLLPNLWPLRAGARQLAGADSGHAYVAQVPATRPVTDYTARIIPHCAGVAVPLEVDPIFWQR